MNMGNIFIIFWYFTQFYLSKISNFLKPTSNFHCFFSIFLPFIDMHYVNLWMKIVGMCQCMVGHLLIKSKKWSFYLPIFCYKSVWSFVPLLFWIKMVFFDEENTRAISENEVALWFLFGIEVLEMIFIVNY